MNNHIGQCANKFCQYRDWQHKLSAGGFCAACQRAIDLRQEAVRLESAVVGHREAVKARRVACGASEGVK
ncbi:MAG: hypothetical protein R8K20_11285 [Gallionellaceae bacterium]